MVQGEKSFKLFLLGSFAMLFWMCVFVAAGSLLLEES